MRGQARSEQKPSGVEGHRRRCVVHTLPPARALLIALFCALFLAACANAPYRYQALDNLDFMTRATALSATSGISP